MKALSILATPVNLFLAKMANVAAQQEEVSTAKKQVAINEKTISQTNWIGMIDRDWLNIDNWSNGLPSIKNHAYIPMSPKGGQFPIITEGCKINFTIKNDGVITNKGKILIMNRGLVQNYGIFENVSSGHIVNRGNVINSGTLVNTGNIENQHVISNGNVIENGGTITNEEKIVDLKALYQSGFKNMPTLS